MLDTMTVHPKVDLSKHHVPHTSHLALHHRSNLCLPIYLGLTGVKVFRFEAGLSTMTVHPKVDLSKHHVPHTSHLALHHRLNPCLPYTLDLLAEGFRFEAGLSTMTAHPKVDLSNAPCTTHLSPNTPPQIKSLLAIYLGLIGEGVLV